MTRCVRCGEKPSTPGEADLIETHEMCRRCRHDDLRELAADTDSTSILEASAAVNAAQDEVVRAKCSLLLAAEFAQYAIEDYADRGDSGALLDALTVYQAAEAARRTASDALAAAVKKELDR